MNNDSFELENWIRHRGGLVIFASLLPMEPKRRMPLNGASQARLGALLSESEVRHAGDLSIASALLRSVTCTANNCPSPMSFLGDLPTMVTAKRVIWTMALLRQQLRLGIEGDVLEAGVYRGGTCIAMMHMLENETSSTHTSGPRQQLWACDSFQGLPQPSELDICGGEDGGHPTAGTSHCRRGHQGRFRAAPAELTANFARFGLEHAMARLHVVRGWFVATLPPAGLKRLSFLRVDGDLHDSTYVTLERLYPLLAPGGLVYVDDYGSFGGCALAVDAFRRERNISARLRPIVETRRRKRLGGELYIFEAVWWRKPRKERVHD